MITFQEVGEMLDDIADGLPEEFYRELNGGIILLPEVKFHPASRDASALYILGEYRNDPFGLGRYIVIFYGSFARAHGSLPPERLKEELHRVLLHEFTHHLQSLGGVRDLEITDARRLEEYRRGSRHGKSQGGQEQNQE